METHSRSGFRHDCYIVWTHVRETIGTIVTSGWRSSFPWTLTVVVALAYLKNLYAPQPIDLKPYYDLAWLVLFAFFFRGAVDKGGLSQLADTALNAIISKRLGITLPDSGRASGVTVDSPRGGVVG